MSSPSKKRKSNSDENAFHTKLKDQSSLRFISSMVCQIVESKETTTYNEVANELVLEAMSLFKSQSDVTEKKKKDHEKNIRRRVYDALNVLLATDIISKTKEKGDKEKTIHWKGYPAGNSVDRSLLEREKVQLLREIERKKGFLVELLVQNVCFRNLEARNRRYKVQDLEMSKLDHDVSHTSSSIAAAAAESVNSVVDVHSTSNKTSRAIAESSKDITDLQKQPTDDHSSKEKMEILTSLTTKDPSTKDDIIVIPESEKIDLPFIIVNTADNAIIQCEMNTDKTEVMFDFSQPFEINDDNEILKRLGLSRTTYYDLKQLLPPNIFRYCENHRLLDSVILPQGYPAPFANGLHGHMPSHPPASCPLDHMPPVGMGSSVSYPATLPQAAQGYRS